MSKVTLEPTLLHWRTEQPDVHESGDTNGHSSAKYEQSFPHHSLHPLFVTNISNQRNYNCTITGFRVSFPAQIALHTISVIIDIELHRTIDSTIVVRSGHGSSAICAAVNKVHVVWNFWHRHYSYQTNWFGSPSQIPRGRVSSWVKRHIKGI